MSVQFIKINILFPFIKRFTHAYIYLLISHLWDSYVLKLCKYSHREAFSIFSFCYSRDEHCKFITSQAHAYIIFPAYTLKTSCNRYNYCIPDNMSICIVNILELITIKKAHKPLSFFLNKVCNCFLSASSISYSRHKVCF